MSKYAYTAVDRQGKEASGIIEAKSEAAALHEIGQSGLVVTNLHTASIADTWRLKWKAHKKTQEQESSVPRHGRQLLAVRYVDGRTHLGVCYAMDPRKDTFHLERIDKEGRTTGQSDTVPFSDLKAVFHVKSLDGKFDSKQFPPVQTPGKEVIVEFRDGETMRGYLHHEEDKNAPRFLLTDADPQSNNVTALIERRAITGVYSPSDYRAKRDLEKRQEAVGSDLCQEETMGDFYFETRNYTAALEQYQEALKVTRRAERVRRKVLAAQYNIGIQHIKQKDYGRALHIMKGIVKEDPTNSHARRKAQQLEAAIAKKQTG